MRWLIGDVQGCAGPFDKLLQEIRFDPARDEVWSLGDLVNRGPDSAAAMRLWFDTGARGVLGNHDIYALLAASGARLRRGDTLDDLWNAPDRDALLGALRALPVLVHLPRPHEAARDVFIVHAGLHPQWSDLDAVARRLDVPEHDDTWLASPDVSFATRVRCCDAQGAMSSHSGPAEECEPPYRAWDAWYRGKTTIVHGHWAFRGFHRSGRVIGLDSGCVYGGKLTAWCQDDDRVVQV